MKDKLAITLVVLLVFVAIFSPQIQDAVSYTGEASKGFIFCVDTDTGKNYDVSGTVTAVFRLGGKWYRGMKKTTHNYADKCLDKTSLQENYCEGVNPKTIKYICPKGTICSNGKCVRTTCTHECYPSGSKTCEGTGYKTCGDYDSDSCSEWSSISSCPTGQNSTASACVATTVYSCTGATPVNADLCSGDDTGLTADTTNSLVPSCTTTKKCEYICKSGYALSNGQCITCTPKTCSQLGRQCGGSMDYECNTYINCGSCPSGQACQDGICSSEHSQILLYADSIQLFPFFSADKGLDQIHPQGQMFNLAVTLHLPYYLPDYSHTVYNIKIEILLDSKIIGMVNLPCEKTGQIIVCRNGVWNAINVPVGTNLYNVKVVGEDSIGKRFFQTRDVMLSFREVDKTLCKELIPSHNNPAANRANLVFAGFGYDKVIGKSAEQALTFIAETLIDLDGNNHGLFSVEPFKSNKNKFNFWYIQKFGSPDDCTSLEGLCFPQVYEPLVENCPYGNTYVIIIKDGNGAIQAAQRVVWHAIPLSPDLPWDSDYASSAFVHEWGHVFADLGDEYVLFPDNGPGYETSTSILEKRKNCYAGPQHTKQECLEKAPWRSMGLDCFEGCDKYGVGIFRSTYASIMDMGLHSGLSLEDWWSFGPWNEKLIQDTLNQFEE